MFAPSDLPALVCAKYRLRASTAARTGGNPCCRQVREKSQTLLAVTWGATKNKVPNLVKVIGIGIEAPTFSGGRVAEDFIVLPCERWSEETKTYCEELNRDRNFFETLDLRQFNDRVKRLLPPLRPGNSATPDKVGGNDPGPCGSGKKFEQCPGR